MNPEDKQQKLINKQRLTTPKHTRYHQDTIKPMKAFLVNFGGPTNEFTTTRSQFDGILQDCKDYYGGTPKATSFTIKGLDVTYYQIGIHRMIKVELPETVKYDLKSPDEKVLKKARETLALYTKAYAKASDFNTTGYKFFGNNCVSAVANVLNTLDPSILDGKKKIVPGALDSKVEEYTQSQSMVYNAISTLSSKNSSHVVKAKPLHSGGVPHGIWQNAMSCPKKERSSSQKSKKILQHVKRESSLPNQFDNVSHHIWQHVMSSPKKESRTSSQQTSLKERLKQLKKDAQEKTLSQEIISPQSGLY
jgi:hypothetical protein